MRVESDSLPPGAIVAVEIAGRECVLWRGHSGRLGSGPRYCPHLDHDLVEGFVEGDELVCAGHGWAFDGTGKMYKRNEFGRVDAKGEVLALVITEDAAGVDVELPR